MVTRVVDLRSDTVTKPTEAMRAAIANADVDDDVLGHDPSCLRLETEMAKIMGKEAALFVPSGTMGNLISVLVHCDIRGSEVILGHNSHIHIYENGGIAIIGGVHPRTVRNNDDGTMDIDLIEAAIRDPKGELVYPTTRLICLENTGNCGGRCLSVEYTDRVGEALGVPVDRLVQAADSVSVCLSKGLGAPVGSVIVGSNSFITKAKRLRKTLGGGMRQVYIEIEEGSLTTAAKLCKDMEDYGILLMPISSSRLRVVFHHQISDTDVQYNLVVLSGEID
ncbi:Threonine aldolase [Sesbania bispinosa]|nr:Threonine aldolase [Sesbania bispinosa]